MENALKLLKKSGPLLAKDRNPDSWQLAKEIEQFFSDYENAPLTWRPAKNHSWIKAQKYGVGLVVIPPQGRTGVYFWAARYNNSMVEGKALSEEDAKERVIQAAKDMFEGRR